MACPTGSGDPERTALRGKDEVGRRYAATGRVYGMRLTYDIAPERDSRSRCGECLRTKRDRKRILLGYRGGEVPQDPAEH